MTEEIAITIPILGNWPRKIMATIVGDLAVHRQLADDGFMVTHIPTMATMMKALDNGLEYEKDELLTWCEKVQQNNKDDWALLRSLTPETYNDKSDRINECKIRILEMCKLVEV